MVIVQIKQAQWLPMRLLPSMAIIKHMVAIPEPVDC